MLISLKYHHLLVTVLVEMDFTNHKKVIHVLQEIVMLAHLAIQTVKLAQIAHLHVFIYN